MALYKTDYIDSSHKMLVDTVWTDTYIWVAVPWTLESDSLWAIKKVNSVNPVSLLYASWTPDFNKVWNNRVWYVYS